MLEARSLTKYYDHRPVVRQVSFQIERGEILGYLGPNGAGKSTTVKMLTGLIEPSDGRIFYQGRSVHDDFTAFQQRTGYVPEEAHLYPHLTGREYLQLVGRLRGMPRRALEPKMDEFLRAFGLWSDRHAPLSSYSKGMRQKVLLSAALLHDPEILILDEPFSGLDVTSAMMLRALLRALAGRGKIILYSSHVLEVVEKICSTVLILREGEVVAYDSIERLRELMQQPSLEGVFAQLAQVDDGNEVANRIVDAMEHREGVPVALPEAPVAAGLRVYRSLARTFPHEFQNVYGEELLQAGEDSIETVWRRDGAWGLTRLLFDIAVHVPIEYAAELGKDIRYALRRLAGSPGFTAVAIISLSLGISIVTCAFSEMNGMALRTAPVVREPEQLVALQLPTSYPNYKRYREQDDLFSSSLAYVAPVPFGVSNGGPTERRWGHLVTSSYFSTLGVHPALGRFIDEKDAQPAGTVPVVVSYRFWQDRLAADAAAIGRTLRVNAQPATVVGVGPKNFLGASPTLLAADLWIPLTAGPRIAPELDDGALERRDRAMFRVVGRLRPGVTMARAEQELDAAAKQMETDNGERDREDKGRRVTLVDGGKLLPLRKQDLPFFTSFFTVMAALITLISFANVTNMMLARAIGRRKEIAVRLSLGASRVRIVRQLLTESMMVVAAAAVPGFLLSVWLMHALGTVRMPLSIPVTFDLRPDWGVLMLMIGLTGAAGLIFGLMPALEATKSDLAPALKEGGNVRFGRRRHNVRNILMISQFAGSLTLLVVLGMLAMGIQSTLGVQTGFNPNGLHLISMDPVRDGHSGGETAAFLHKLLDSVKALPSVQAACFSETVPVSLAGGSVKVSAYGAGTREVVNAFRHVVGKDYFETTGTAILRGRAFREEDERNQTAAVVVSREFARTFWGESDSLGRQIEVAGDQIVPGGVLVGTYDYRVRTRSHSVYQVIGVAGDVAEGLIVQKPRPALYFPLRAADFTTPPAEGITLMVRAAPGFDVVSAVRRAMAAIDTSVTPFQVRSMAEQIDQFMAPLNSAAWTYRIIGIFGLILSAVGLAGMTAYSVAQRGREIGIRMALGAQKGNVLALVMKEGLMLVAAGTLMGLAGAWTGSRLLASMNSSVGRVTTTSTSDATVLVGAPLLLAGLALLACYVPARRSMRVDPAAALRQE